MTIGFGSISSVSKKTTIQIYPPTPQIVVRRTFILPLFLHALLAVLLMAVSPRVFAEDGTLPKTEIIDWQGREQGEEARPKWLKDLRMGKNDYYIEANKDVKE